ncbi:MAG: 2OG-Fe(II) oxygenase [Alphaproteobacteria bacterium]|nr:2OG-Fe(II) oxygenase [Alphaproteobacteria bacterium]MBU0796793.1 2OG-Fe(II) oxygenase [Alphaproteobacteria bacterium]MBU0885849.1 2OG-Fe(II) oxygenase [Alphaproteobacteria bacterium]MBU1812075.1 2OG-Fe(II) oxygenase [Alphaproteobacteria bacterium]
MSTGPVPRVFAQPAPHRVSRNFLGPDLIARLLAHVEAKRDAFTPTQISSGKIDPDIRVSWLLRDLGGLRDALAARFLAIMDPMIADLRLSPFDLGRLEMEIVAHGDGAFYRRHIDTQTGAADRATDRALTSVLYFHAEPQNYSGGELRLHSILPLEEGGCFLDIMPEQDMLLLFPSWAPHEVRPISCPSGAFMDQRFAINCWYRSQRTP